MTKKKKIRAAFRQAVFERDGYKCRFCDCTEDLDAHHITDRSKMPNGGYVLENGITLCKEHHFFAELHHQTNGEKSIPGMMPVELYKIIGSSYELAYQTSTRNAP